MSGRETVTPQIAVAMVDALRAGALTYDDLVSLTRLKKTSVARWIKAVRNPLVRVLRVAEWRPDKNDRVFVPAFTWSTEPDAERPGPSSTSAARMRQQRADPARRAKEREAARLRRQDPVLKAEARTRAKAREVAREAGRC